MSADLATQDGSTRPALTWFVDHAIAILVIAGLALTVTLVVRYLLVRRALRDRVTYELVPASDFDTSLPAIRAFARRLARVRPAVSLTPRRAQSLRVSVVCDSDGMLRSRLTVPAAAAAILRAGTYPGVEPRTQDDVPTMAAYRADNTRQAGTGDK